MGKKRGPFEFSRKKRFEVREAYDYCCAKCGAKKSGLQVHHIIPVFLAKELGLPSQIVIHHLNGMALCSDCHREIHRHDINVHEIIILLATITNQLLADGQIGQKQRNEIIHHIIPCLQSDPNRCNNNSSHSNTSAGRTSRFR